MINSSGRFYTETLESLNLTGEVAATTTTNAKNIIRKIISAYDSNVGSGQVGGNGRGVPSNFRKKAAGPIGLIYGRIQSGKTRAMVTSTAMAFDNAFRIALVMTSNINDLVSQTHLDFSRDLKGVTVLTKDDELNAQIENVTIDLSSPNGRLLVITSKGEKSLNNVLRFLTSIDAKKYPMLIFDDEGDQASLDTNTYKRSQSGNLTLTRSTINELIARTRNSFPTAVYVSVTGTPQAVLLQTASSDNKPSFIYMLPPSNGYIGGDYFFATPEPQDNPNHLIATVPAADQTNLLNPTASFPEGLRDAILYFLLAAAAAKANMQSPGNGKGYQFLCHPALKNNQQSQAKNRIATYLTEIKKILIGYSDSMGILPAFDFQYRALRTKLGLNETPALPVLKRTIEQELLRIKILVINSRTKRRGIEYGPGFNILVGGNSLGRGIAIPNLLVTYYVRQAVISQMDTMHQHARMFGYRGSTLQYTKLFTTLALYFRFRDIYTSDQALRDFIDQHVSQDPNSFPIDTSIGLNPTRKGVLDAGSIETVAPGVQIYPNRMKLPQPSKNVEGTLTDLYKFFHIRSSDKNSLEALGRQGILIPVEDANRLLARIKTLSSNSWHDHSIQSVLLKLSDILGNKIRLKYRSALRAIQPGGLVSSGTLSGREQADARRDRYATLWIMDVTPRPDGSVSGNPFIFPTIVVPDRMQRIFVFTKK